MSTPTNTQHPSREQIRAARHAGFDDSVSYLAQPQRERLTSAHRPQDARREQNISGFYERVLSGDA